MFIYFVLVLTLIIMTTVYPFESPLYQNALIGVVLLMVIAAVILLFRKRRRHKLRLETILSSIAQKEVSSIIIPDGIGGLIEIDKLILTEYGLLLVETYPMSGHLFGSDTIDQWTQIIDGRSFKFTNPLHHLNNVKQAIQQLTPKVPIHIRIIFTEESNFPKGKPDSVSTLNTLEQDLLGLTSSPKKPELTQKAWERVLRIGRYDGQAIVRDNTA
jgi:hypothetical protein